MATFGGRDYRNNNDSPRGGAPEQPRGYEPGPGNNLPPDHPNPGPSAPTEDRGYQDRGGGYDRGGDRGGSGRGGYDRDPNYAFIGYLYRGGRGGGFSVFLKPEMIEILKSLTEDDILGISPSGKDGTGWMIYGRRVDPQKKDDYRRNGGRGGKNGGGYGGGNRGGGYNR